LYSGAYASLGVDNSSLESFFKDFKIEIIELKDDMIEFDMIGIDAALANAFRRILIAEVLLFSLTQRCEVDFELGLSIIV